MSNKLPCRLLFVGAVFLGSTFPFWAPRVAASLIDQSPSSSSQRDHSPTRPDLEDVLFDFLATEPLAVDVGASDSEQPVVFSEYIRLHHDSSDEQNSRKSFRILQFGDSHTAGDFFTDQLRTSLQKRFGDGGIGWIQPASISGQRTSLYSLKRSGRWTNQYQKNRSTNLSLPIGGYSALGTTGSRLSVVPRRPLPRVGKVHFSALVRSRNASKANVSLRVGPQLKISKSVDQSWQLIAGEFGASSVGSYDFVVDRGMVEVAALFLDSDQKGVTVEAVGRNGAELFWQEKWSTASVHALFKNRPVDLIVLAYGTNEAVDTIDAKQYTTILNRQIRLFKSALPDTPIVIVSVPSFAKYPNSSCHKPHSLMQIHAAQTSVGQKTDGVSTWSWLQAMGGPCAVRSWANQGRMASDWIHFSSGGYRQSAILFEQWLSKQKF